VGVLGAFCAGLEMELFCLFIVSHYEHSDIDARTAAVSAELLQFYYVFEQFCGQTRDTFIFNI